MGSPACTRNPPSGPGPASSAPPSAVARSRMPAMPLPAAVAARRRPGRRPSSSTSHHQRVRLVGEPHRSPWRGPAWRRDVGQRLLHDAVARRGRPRAAARRLAAVGLDRRRRPAAAASHQAVELGRGPAPASAGRASSLRRSSVEHRPQLAQRLLAGLLDRVERRRGPARAARPSGAAPTPACTLISDMLWASDVVQLPGDRAAAPRWPGAGPARPAARSRLRDPLARALTTSPTARITISQPAAPAVWSADQAARDPPRPGGRPPTQGRSRRSASRPAAGPSRRASRGPPPR